jgi:hypothetical protein
MRLPTTCANTKFRAAHRDAPQMALGDCMRFVNLPPAMVNTLLSSVSARPVRWAFWLILVGGILLTFAGRRWEKSRVVDQDVISYYSYLPAAFVYGDISMQYCTSRPFFSDKVRGIAWRDGLGPVQKYTMGMAVLYAPFFAVGHAHAHLSGATPDGYSRPYRFWLQWSGLFYLLLGLHWLRRVLSEYFQPMTVALTLLALAFGTNLLYYTVGDPCMPHVGTFALVAGLMWASLRWHAQGRWTQALAVAVLASLLTLIRPNHVILWSIPLLAGVSSGAELGARVRFLLRHWMQLLLWVLVLGLVLLPQLCYWKHLTGQWLYYSYGEEGFFFNDPKLLQLWFGFRKGWLLYTPMMGLALLGWWQVRRYAPGWMLLGPLLLAILSYVLASWWCWWYGGSFGHRGFIDLYPLLAIGLAAAWQAVRDGRRNWRYYAFAGLAGLFLLLNVFQIYQYRKGLLHADSMTAAAYGAIWGRLTPPPGLETRWEAPDYAAALRGQGR